jgi:hypothetical protein
MDKMSAINTVGHPRRRGAVIVLTAVSIATLLMCATLAIDVGYICALTTEQQNNADAAALAGASALQEGDWWGVHERALHVLERNQKAQGYLSLEDQIIEVGWYDSVNDVFHVLDDPTRAFAVRVRAARNQAPLFFAPLMGRYATDVWREAVAVGSGSCTGIWGIEGITAGSINTDSYDSTEQEYSMVTARQDGDLCSGRHIDVHGSADIQGDVMAGFGYDLTVAGGSAVITGMTTSNSGEHPSVPADLSDSMYFNDNHLVPTTDSGRSPYQKGELALDIQGGDNLTLPPGNYYFESLKLGGGSTITITGPSTLYFAGPIDATGGTVVNANADPHDLTIISVDTTVKLSGGSAFYGSVLAPNAVVELKGEAFYGALVAKYVNLVGDFSVHVDESLELAKPLLPPPALMLVQ